MTLATLKAFLCSPRAMHLMALRGTWNLADVAALMARPVGVIDPRKEYH